MPVHWQVYFFPIIIARLCAAVGLPCASDFGPSTYVRWSFLFLESDLYCPCVLQVVIKAAYQKALDLMSPLWGPAKTLSPPAFSCVVAMPETVYHALTPDSSPTLLAQLQV